MPLKGGVFISLDVQTLTFVLSLILVTQVIALSVQYRVNKTYPGIGWWLLGSGLMAIGFVFMPLLKVNSLEMLARIANPLVVLGQIFIYIGIMRFLKIRENKWVLISIFAFFISAYYYFMYFNSEITGRTVVVSVTIAAISFMAAYSLFSKRDRLISCSANFTTAVFVFYGCFLFVRTIVTLFSEPIHSYAELGQTPIYLITSLVPIIASTLWTFGFIIMVNQSLNIENSEEKEKYRSILNASPDNITITDLQGRILMVSPASNKMFGYEPDSAEFIGLSLTDFIVPEEVERAQANLGLMYRGGFSRPNEYRGVRKDGSIFDIEVNSGFIYGANGQPAKMVFIIRDITERKLSDQHIQELVHQLEHEKNTAQLNSNTDNLTGLANRRYLDEALDKEFYRLKRSGSVLSVVMLDVDYFKKFNDMYGHLAGDDCLRQIGATLKTIAGRAPDIVSRYGGEEFIVILPETESKGALTMAKQIQKAIKELAIPHSASEVAEYVTVSLGVATVSTTGLKSPEQVVSLADEAMYSAKKGGRNCIVVAD